MDERDFDQRVQCIICIFRGIAQGFEQYVYETLNLRVVNDFAETFQASICCETHFFMTVVENTRQRWNYLRQALSELLRVEICHGTKQVACALFTSPLLIIESF